MAGLNFDSGDGIEDATMTFTGSLADVDTAIANLDYRGNANFNGPDTLTIKVNDQGNTGSGGSQTDMKTVAITVDAVNDAPVLTVPGRYADGHRGRCAGH
ncbi:MAG: hypothetical protein ACC645_16735 [Pirellulales bacterium]